MNCPQYLSLSTEEQCVLAGKVIHLLQNDASSFHIMSSLVRYAEHGGAFDKVKIGQKEIADSETTKQSSKLTQFEVV